MKIAVIGAGAIGGVIAGYLKNAGQDVVVVGHPDAVGAIRQHGLRISGVRAQSTAAIEAVTRLQAPVDAAIFAVKTQDISLALTHNAHALTDAMVLTTQNGVRADDIVAQKIPKERIISSIVMFGATYVQPGSVVHNFEGRWIIGRPYGDNDAAVESLAAVLHKAFPIVVTNEIWGMKWLKVFVNANNCVPALVGASMQETFADRELCKISIFLWKEALGVVRHAGIPLVSLPDFPADRIDKLTEISIEAAVGIFSGIMTHLSQEPLYGSILQSIQRGKPSEIDYLNGEFVSLAKNFGIAAPLNEKLVHLVHKVERTKKFLTKQELIEHVKEYLK